MSTPKETPMPDEEQQPTVYQLTFTADAVVTKAEPTENEGAE